MKVERIGIDLAKNVMQVFGVNRQGKRVFNKAVKRTEFAAFMVQLEPCLVGMESCGSAHYWGRELRRMGHEVKLIAPHFVTPYRKNGKNDSNDAEAICEAVSRPTMRFVAIKDPEQQAVLVVHRVRQRVVAERTALINQIRGLLSEFGIVIALGADRVRKDLPAIVEDVDGRLPALARQIFADLYDQLCVSDQRVARLDRHIKQLAKQMPAAKRLMAVEGVGPVIATALIASAGDANTFDNGRQFAAWLGLVPRQHSTGGRTRLGRITKRGDVYLRCLLVHGARSVMIRLGDKTDPKSTWARELKQRRGFNKATVAMAAKNARTLWALMAHEDEYRGALVAA